MITYKTDDSFFTYITPKLIGYYISPIREWFWKTPQATHRFIYNNNMAIHGTDFRTIEEFYPTVKTILVVVNPWQVWYDQYKFNTVNQARLFQLNSSIRPTLTEYLRTRLSLSVRVPSQLSFGQYYENGNLHQSHCIFRYENLEQEFRLIQQYFETDNPLILPKLEDYRPHYTDESRKLIETLYAEDIARFGYTF